MSSRYTPGEIVFLAALPVVALKVAVDTHQKANRPPVPCKYCGMDIYEPAHEGFNGYTMSGGCGSTRF